MASTIKGDNVQNQPGTNIIDKCGTTITLGQSGDTIALACGASQTGFGRTGTVDWITTPKVTGDSPVTGVTGKGYFLNTTAGVITINLPAGSAGDIISLADYAGTWQTNVVTVAPNGSEKIGGSNTSVVLSIEGQSVTLVYVDSTQGWVTTMDSTSDLGGKTYIVATGGNSVTTCGGYKIHSFTGPGTFCVSSLSCNTANNEVSYLVVAGGGGGGSRWRSGGGGAGGFRENKSPVDIYAASPLNGSPPIRVTASPYSISVGGGGAGGGPPTATLGVSGNPSTFSAITSTGGGFGSQYISPGPSPSTIGSPGGSGGGGGGGGGPSLGGCGNTPPTSPSQGFPGGAGQPSSPSASGGGGGATVAGTDGCGNGPLGSAGGAGAGTLINPATGEAGPGPSRYYAGGGGGGQYAVLPGVAPSGGIGGGGDGGYGNPPASPIYTHGCSATVNTGGGGGGKAGEDCVGQSGSGGSGIVIIRYKFQ